MSAIVSVHLTIRGRVQGVGYREWMRRTATALGLSGWVRNVAGDRSVEAVISGPEGVVEEMIAACRRGPIHADVTSVERRPGEAVAGGFEVLPTRA